jgi:hypothetical protein
MMTKTFDFIVNVDQNNIIQTCGSNSNIGSLFGGSNYSSYGSSSSGASSTATPTYNTAALCSQMGGTLTNNVCVPDPATQCTQSGGTWSTPAQGSTTTAAHVCIPNPATACAQAGGTWTSKSNGSTSSSSYVCIYNTAASCALSGGILINFDQITKCVPDPVTACSQTGSTWGIPYPSATYSTCMSSAQSLCSQQGGTWTTPTPGVTACALNPQAACLARGSSWNGTSCDEQVTNSVACAAIGGYWNSTAMFCDTLKTTSGAIFTTAAEDACTSIGGVYSNGICKTQIDPSNTPNQQNVCTLSGGTWSNGACSTYVTGIYNGPFLPTPNATTTPGGTCSVAGATYYTSTGVLICSAVAGTTGNRWIYLEQNTASYCKAASGVMNYTTYGVPLCLIPTTSSCSTYGMIDTGQTVASGTPFNMGGQNTTTGAQQNTMYTPTSSLRGCMAP